MRAIREKKIWRGLVRWTAAWSLAISAPAGALDLRLTSGNWRPINIFVEAFAGESQRGALSDIIRADLVHSGYFRGHPAPTGGDVDSARYAEVRARGGEYLLTGVVHSGNSGIVDGGGEEEEQLFFELHDALTEKSLGELSIKFTDDSRRLAAHTVSNYIFETLAKLPGVFHTKVAYIVRESDGTNLLRVADYDGYNAHTVLSSPEPLISPSWSPDGNEILYVSFERRKPVVYRQSLLTGERQVVANFPGSNSAPAMSPDGRNIAVALTDNQTLQQIFILSAAGRQRMRDVKNVIDTEPAWSPDGRRIAFESDERGGPHIYEFDLADGGIKRVTKSNLNLTKFPTKYAVSPSYDSTGGRILHIRRTAKGRNNVAVTDLESGETAVLTDIREADSPSFSPNDAMVLFKNEKFANSLQIVAINGIILSQWKVLETGKIINPVWSPASSDWF